MPNYIPLSVPNLSGNELKYTTTAIKTEWVSTAGPYIPDFEKSVASFTGMADAVACQSGSAALHLAFMEVGVERGDLVIVPDLTFAATVNPVTYIGADPVFMDCDDSLCVDPIKLRDFCREECEMRNNVLFHKSNGRRVSAVVPVHIFGNLADMEAIMDIANEFYLAVVEDAAEALGSFWSSGRYAGKHAGTVGDIGVLSFNGNKIVTTGGGGMLISENQNALDHMRYLSQQSKDDMVRFIHNEVGYNYRLTNLQAALGIAQMEQLPGFIDTKKQNYELYLDEGLELLPFREGVKPNYWFYSLMSHGNRDTLMEQLRERNIESRPVWELMHRLPPFKNCIPYRIERAKYYHAEIVNIPCSTNLSEDTVRFVAAQIKDILN